MKLHLDGPLLAALCLLGFIGLVNLYSASGQDGSLVFNQALRLGLAFGLAIILAQLPTDFWQKLAPGLFVLGLLLLLAVALVGDISKGARRWLDLGVVRFQPSELMKLALPMLLAWLYAQVATPPRLFWVGIGLSLIAAPAVLILKQPDLGTALLVISSGGLVIYLAGLHYRHLLIALVLGLVSLPIVWELLHDYQRQRVYTFLNPGSDKLGSGWNTEQAIIAIGSGGLYGKGWLQGSQTHHGFIPERHTDFIFAAFAEEWGLVSAAALIGLYGCIVLRGLILASRAPSRYGQLLAGNLSLMFFVYMCINIGMVSGLLPVVGVPLPLMSYGGTSVMTLLIGFGILMAVTRPAPQRRDFS